MARILDPDMNDDDAGFAGIRVVAGITADDATINADPLFLAAEDYIIGLISDAADRSYANRPQIIRALQFLTAYYFLEGGGNTAGTRSTAASGEVRRRTRRLGPLSLSEEFNVSTSSASGSTSSDRGDFLKEQADNILESLGATIQSDMELLVLSTESLLPESDNFNDTSEDPGMLTSIYQYDQLYTLTSLSDETVTGDANDAVLNLLMRRTVPGGILPNNDFVTDYEGFIQVTNGSGNTGLELTLLFTHGVGNNPDFVSTRRYRQRLGANVNETIPLASFNSRSRIPTGEYNTQDGTRISVTEADFANPIEIQLDLRISLYNRAFTQKATANSTTVTISSELAEVHFWQLIPQVRV